MKVLVTGGSGFIGSHTVARLQELGHEPVIYDRRHRHRSDVETILGDIRDAVAVTEAVAHVEAVMHLAGVLGTQETISDPYPAAETNILGGINVFQAVRHYELPAVYIAVGNHWMDNTYSISKTTAERFARMFNHELGTQIRIVRALNAYGPGQALPAPWGPSKVRKVMPTFAAQALSGVPIEIYGSGEQIMDVIYVSDVADVLCRALSGPHAAIYEAGTGRPTSVLEIAEAVIETVGHGEIKHLPMRPGEIPDSVVLADPKTLAPLGVDPAAFRSLEDGLKLTLEYFAELV